MSREIMQRSLATFKVLDEGGGLGYENHALIRRQIETLEEALAKPEQEPVQFLLNGARYKVALQHHFGNSIVGLPEHLNGQWVALVDATDGKHLNYTAPPRKERELEQAIREERGRCHQLVWDYGFSRVDNEDVQEACSILAKQILAGSKK